MSVDKILEERGKRYGAFKKHAEISQTLKAVMSFQKGWHYLEDHQQEALEMIAHKIARILNGDPKYIDNWDDLAGYATLVANELRAELK